MEKYHKIPRNHGWEIILEALIRKLTNIYQSDVRAGCYYEDEILKIQPFFDKICNCSYQKAKDAFDAENQHSEDCFATHLAEINLAFQKHPKYTKALVLKTERMNMITKLCDLYDIKRRVNLDNICTCGYNKKWAEQGVAHEETCQTLEPNLWFKPDDVKIWWKYTYFRDAYSNKPITIEDFKIICLTCKNNANKKKTQPL